MLVTQKVIIMRERALCFNIYKARIMILVNAVLITANSISVCLTVQQDHTYGLSINHLGILITLNTCPAYIKIHFVDIKHF